MRILIADDSQTNRYFITSVLKKYGHEMFTAENGMDTLLKVGEINPDLVILDILMPEMDGYEVCNFISNNPDTKDIPVIILTSLSQTEDLVKAFAAGAMDFIKKPPSEPELIARVNSALRIKQYHDKLKDLIVKDGLTQLYTHTYFATSLERMMYSCKRYNSELGIVLLDIDDFKQVNDTYGHVAGDNVLRLLAEILQKSIRKSDIAARYGGEEFAILVPHTNLEDTKMTAERLRAEVEKAVIKDKKTDITVTISLGLTMLKQEDEEITDIVIRTDDALYESKRNGKNRVTALLYHEKLL